MATQLLSVHTGMGLLIAIFIFIIRRFLLPIDHFAAMNRPKDTKVKMIPPKPTALSKSLAAALPGSVILPSDAVAFKKSKESYWAQQEWDVVPACVVRPSDVHQVSTAVTILNQEYERMRQAGEQKAEGLFAVRSGGCSPVSGAASIRGGVVIDLSLFREVTVSDDESSVTIGAGNKWSDVSKILDAKGLAVVGGRTSAVGVGGLILGGGFSIFSPRFGLVCNNVISYEVVLASGFITTASESNAPDLWRALKGGSNNFGTVTRFTVRCFPCDKIWGGFLFMPAFQGAKALAAFHEFVSRAGGDDNPNTTATTRYDPNAASPIASFTYISKLYISVISLYLVHTNPLSLPMSTSLKHDGNNKSNSNNQWPSCFQSSLFSSLWRLWSTCNLRTLTSLTDEMDWHTPLGKRKDFGTTTIRNDPATLTAVHAAYRDVVAALRPARVKGLIFSLSLQALLPEWARMGVGAGEDADPPLGLEGEKEPLVMVSFSVYWDEGKDDELVRGMTRWTIEEIEQFAKANGTGHRFRYLNYCDGWQRPFKGYGEEGWRFLKGVSRKYDEGGLFQKGCVGGFKLGMDGEEDRESEGNDEQGVKENRRDENKEEGEKVEKEEKVNRKRD